MTFFWGTNRVFSVLSWIWKKLYKRENNGLAFITLRVAEKEVSRVGNMSVIGLLKMLHSCDSISGKLSHHCCFLKWILRMEPAVALIIPFISLKVVHQSCAVPWRSREQSLGILDEYKERGNEKSRGSFGGQVRRYLSLLCISLLLVLKECDTCILLSSDATHLELIVEYVFLFDEWSLMASHARISESYHAWAYTWIICFRILPFHFILHRKFQVSRVFYFSCQFRLE